MGCFLFDRLMLRRFDLLCWSAGVRGKLGSILIVATAHRIAITQITIVIKTVICIHHVAVVASDDCTTRQTNRKSNNNNNNRNNNNDNNANNGRNPNSKGKWNNNSKNSGAVMMILVSAK